MSRWRAGKASGAVDAGCVKSGVAFIHRPEPSLVILT